MNKYRRNWMWIYVAIIWSTVLIMGVMAVLSGCTTTQYVPVETVRTEYRDREVEHLVTDTVRDTRFILVKGDTVVDWRDRWHTQREYVHDTCYVECTDTIRVPYPVEKDLTRWERAKMDFGGIAIGGILFAVSMIVIWLIRKFRK